MSDPQGGTLSTTTRKDLREVAGGNLTIEEIVNRARFDDTFPIRRFSVLLEHADRPPLCYFYTWENGICKYGTRCRYFHDPQVQLRSLDDRPLCPKSTMQNLSRSSLADILHPSALDGINFHAVAFIEYQGRIVWFRDGGKNSRSLWEKCLSKIVNRSTQLRAIASSICAESVQSAPESVKLIELLREENFNSLFNYLPVHDMYNMLVAFASSSYIRHESRTCMLSNTVWDSAISNKWSVSFSHHQNPLQSFLSLNQSTTEAHAFLASSTFGLFTYKNSSPDSNPCTGVPAITEYAESFPGGKTILISDDCVPVSDIRFNESLIATANGSEVSLLRRGDLVKVSTSSKLRLSAEKVTIVPAYSGNNWLVHAGQGDIFLRDMDEPGLKLVKKISCPDSSSLCCSLDATPQAVFIGFPDRGLCKVDTETGQFSSILSLNTLSACKMWSTDGRLHVFSTSESLSFWDLRMRDKIPIVTQAPCTFGFSQFSSPLLVMGTNTTCSGIDIRTGKSLWSLSNFAPVTHLSVSENTVATFTGTPANPFTEISVHDITRDPASPTRIGEHSIPFRVSAVGFPCDASSTSGGCVFAVKSRPKRSGRGGDDGILCIGGSGFMSRSSNNKRVSSAGSTPRAGPSTPPTRRSSRDHSRSVHFLV